MLRGDNDKRGLVLRHAGSDLPLKPGEWYIGRDPSCLVRLDDPLISRRHAVLRVSGTSATIADLSSANGVFVNGERVVRPKTLSPGDRVLIGRQELEIRGSADSDRAPDRQSQVSLHEISRENLRPLSSPGKQESTSAADATTRVDTFALMSTVVDRMLEGGRVADAERLLTPHLDALSKDIVRGKKVADGVAQRAAEYCVKLAQASGRGQWIDRAVQLYAGLRQPMPTDIADAIIEATERASGFDGVKARDYVSSIRGLPGHLSLEARTMLDRLEGALRGPGRR